MCDWAAILPSALSGVACVALLHRLARRLGADTFQAFAGSVVLLTTSYFLKYSAHAMFDVFLTLLFVLAMLAYRRAWEGRLAAWAALGALAGLGVLTKSVLGTFPLVVAALHLLWCGRARVLLTPGPWLALLALLATIAPWYGAQLAIQPDRFVHEHIAWLLWERGFVTGREQQTLATRAAYFTEIAKVYWPWLPLMLAGAWGAARAALGASGASGADRAAWDAAATARLLIVWPVVVIGVMSLGNEKKLWYVMSAFPAFALLVARPIAAWLRDDGLRRRIVHGTFAVLAAAGAVLAFTPVGRPAPRRPDLQVVAHAARTLVPASETIFTPDGSYYSTAHQFVYYSRRDLDKPLGDSLAVRAALDAGRWGLFTTTQRAKYLGADTLAYPSVVSSGKWALVHAGARPEVRLEASDAFE